MTWLPLGDGALLAQVEGAARLARKLREEAIPECLDVVSSYHHLAVYFSPADYDVVRAWLAETGPSIEEGVANSRTHHVLVKYDREIIQPLADALELSVDEVISLHQSARYTVAAMGFSPGFPYLEGLPKELFVPRRDLPVRIPAGTVAIAGEQAGIYPTDSFGGWHALGTTRFSLFDAERFPYSPLEPGDEIVFEAEDSPLREANLSEDDSIPAGHPVLEIISSATGTTVQDLGRPGFRHLGVTSGGAADWESAMVANLLLGNEVGAPLIEFCLQVPEVTFLRDVTMAFVGIDHPGAGSPQRYRAGETLQFRGRPTSSYGYLAIAGGFDVPEILGSASTDVRAGLGGRVLRVGDSLGQGKAVSQPILGPGQRVLWPGQPTKERLLTLRVLLGLQEEWFDEDSRESLTAGSFLKSAQFDRTGARLEGPSLMLEEARELTSQPVVPGTIQVPPSGEPIVLTAECQTIGGYPVIAHIISADLPAFTRALPGTQIRFQKVTLEEALEADRLRKRELAFLKTGLQLLLP